MNTNGDDYVMPTDVRLSSAADRIKWHQKRIRGRLPAIQLLDNIETGLSPDEIRIELERVRLNRERLEEAMKGSGE